MFEQQQNTGKSASLAEKYANAVGQLSEANDRAAHAEHDLQVERITRQDLIDEEVARRVAEAKERIRQEVEAELAEKAKALAERDKALDQREAEVDKKAENIAQNISEQVRQQMSAAKTRFEKTALARLADMFEMFMQAFIALGDKDSAKGQELLSQYRQAAKEAEDALTSEIKDKLAKVEANSKSKADQIASLVRMIFTQKRERVVFSKEERETIYDEVLSSVDFTDEEKRHYQECRDFCENFRRRKAIKKLLNSQKEQKGHGRNPIPEDMPRLAEKILWPDGYLGHEDEYEIVYEGKVQEFIVPAKVRYFVQPYRRPVVRRKDDPMQHLLQSPCYEGVFWKSYASAELLAQLECCKYVLHQPFNRQIKKMKQDGLILSPSTVDDWHQGVCDKIEPLYNLQKERVMSSLLLGADGSPFPILDCEKHKTVNHYLIQYRSVQTGIPIFLVNTKNKHGRGTADIMDNLKDWKGVALMCDAYSGYDWLKKINGRILCRCVVHARRPMERALKENPKLARIGLLFYQNINLIEEIIKEKKLQGEEKAQFRRDHAEPLWENFKLWAASAILGLPKDTNIFKALNYMLRNYTELTNYIDIPDMPLDNNDTERLIRDMVMGKKSYLFCRDLDACKRAAMMYSLFGACKVLDKNPERWLCYVLKHIDTTPEDKLYTLLPEFWEDGEQ
nr:IS66 family transposase [uncultured Prevotella sp.]